MARKKDQSKTPTPNSIVSSTPEGRESQCIALAYNLVEERLRNGTATSQETVHFLKLASQKYKSDLEKQRTENELLKAKADAIRAQEDLRQITEEAMRAMVVYRGDE
jgi:hypothetical protein